MAGVFDVVSVNGWGFLRRESEPFGFRVSGGPDSKEESELRAACDQRVEPLHVGLGELRYVLVHAACHHLFGGVWG